MIPPALLRAMSRCEPGAPRGALVAFRDLWPQLATLGVDRTAGESAILALCQTGELCLHEADRIGQDQDTLAASLPVPGSNQIYIGLAIRQS